MIELVKTATRDSLRQREHRRRERLTSAREFQRSLAREQARADRYDYGFALLILEPADLVSRRQVNALARAVSERVRTSDEAGWLDSSRLGVILPCTSADGAQVLAQDIQRLLGDTLPLRYEIFACPSDSPDNFPTSRRDRDREPSSALVEVGLQEGISPSTGDQRNGERTVHGSPVAFCTSAGGRQARPLSLSDLVERRFRAKRIVDVLGAGVGLVLAAPLFLAVAILIKLGSPGPVFFRQERIGYLGRPFRIWKFRTMKTPSVAQRHQQYVRELVSSNGTLKKLDLDEEFIPLGKWLRRLCIDELPQLLNVLEGHMSLVGPRPDVVPPEQYSRWHRQRFRAQPGLTGLWQVRGKNRTTFTEMMRLDIRYVERRSLWLDTQIILLTPLQILKQVFGRDGE